MKAWLLYDGRANIAAGTNDAVVLTVSRSIAEARRDAKEGGYGECHIWSYDVTVDNELVNEEYVESHE